MSRRLAAAGALTVGALLIVSCSSGGDSAVDGDGTPGAEGTGPAATDTSLGTDASLIPPSGATSPTSGPPNTDPLAGAGAPNGATCQDHGTPSPASASDDLELRVQLRETLETGRIRWALTVANRGERAVTLVYPTAQDGDIVLRQDGDVAYRWSEEQVFAQQQRCQLIGAAQEFQFTLRGTDLDVDPGDYELVASLAADPTPEPARIDVTVVDGDGN